MTKAGPSFEEALARGLAEGKLADALRPFRALRTPDEARALVAALDGMTANDEGTISGPLHAAVALYQSAEDEAIVAVLRQGFPRLLALYDRTLAALSKADERATQFRLGQDLAFALKIFAMWPTAGGGEALRRVMDAARSPLLRDGFLWQVVFRIYASKGHPRADEIAGLLRSPLPTEGFVAIAFLDFVNTLCREARLAEHPYADDEGVAWLETKLRQTEHPSHAHSAAAALPFLPSMARARLLPMATAYPELQVRLEAAWADVKCGGSAGLFTLVAMCRDPHATRLAQAYLRELGHEGSIPKEARERDFVALAEMSSWLQHPNEFGAAPDRLVLYDTREILWPPTRDRRRVWLFEYTYAKAWGREGERKVGLGMVGGITFALAGETTEGMSPEDAYAIHCCWELQTRKDPRAPKERSIAAGRRMLGF